MQWKGKLISLGGKLILIKSVLEAIPSYLLALIQPLTAIINAINKTMSNFFWHDTSGHINIIGQNRVHYVFLKK